MRLPPLPQIPHPFHKLPIRRNNLYRNKLLIPLPRHLPCDVCELFDEIILRPKYPPGLRLCEETFKEGGVRCVR
jgi:hypothetical protein